MKKLGNIIAGAVLVAMLLTEGAFIAGVAERYTGTSAGQVVDITFGYMNRGMDYLVKL